MTILILTPFLEGVGGVAVAVEHLRRVLEADGHSVIRLTRGRTLRIEKSQQGHYTARFRTPGESLRSRLSSLLALPLTGCSVWAFIKATRVEAVLVQYPRPGYLPVVLVCRLLRIPCCVSFQGGDATSLRSLSHWPATFMRRLLESASEVTAVSSSLVAKVEEFASTLTGRVRVIPNGSTPVLAVRRVKPSPQACTVLAVGKLIHRKGFDVLIRALASLKARAASVNLRIVGEGEARPELESLARSLGVQDAVVLVGELEHDRVQEEMLDCDVFALPSRAEGLALVLVEAMACGCAIVATSVDGAQDVLEDGRTALLVQSEDVSGLTDAIGTLVQQPEMRTRLGEEALARSRTLTWAGVAKLYLDSCVRQDGDNRIGNAARRD